MLKKIVSIRTIIFASALHVPYANIFDVLNVKNVVKTLTEINCKTFIYGITLTIVHWYKPVYKVVQKPPFIYV